MSQTKPGTSLQVWRLNRPAIPAPRLPSGAESRVIQIMKNSGNELNKCFRTNEITLLNAALFALFACESTPNKASKEQKTPHFAQRTETCESPGEARTVTRTRLHKTDVTLRDGSLPGGNVR
jgi:hypothetical protein